MLRKRLFHGAVLVGVSNPLAQFLNARKWRRIVGASISPFWQEPLAWERMLVPPDLIVTRRAIAIIAWLGLRSSDGRLFVH